MAPVFLSAGDTLEWDNGPENAVKIVFANTILQDSRMYIISLLPLPDIVMSEIKACTSWDQLLKLRRFSLIYGMTILKTTFSPAICFE